VGVKDFWKKSERVLVIIFLLIIPTQLGKHFWTEGSYVMGTRVDYLSPTLYLVDGVWIIMFLVSSLRSRPKLRMNFGLAVTLVLVLMNVVVAENKIIAIYRWLRIGQGWWTLNYFWRNKERLKKLIIKIIPWWIGVEVTLGWMQMVTGGSMGGFWYWLGERRFNFNTVGIAQMSVNGEGFLRAYGTFSHPNSLAGSLAAALILWTKVKRKNVFWWVVMFLGISGIVICGSRTVWVVMIIAMILSLIKWKRKIGLVLIGVGLVILVNSSGLVGGWDKESWSKRMVLNKAAVEMIKDNLWLGVGAGNFLVKLVKYQESGPYWWQPVHNIPLLVTAEIGVLGILWLGWVLNKFFKKTNIILIGIILITAMVDHYWVTLPQNSWLLVVVLALMG